MTNASFDLFAACQPGLEPLLLRELTDLDLDAKTVPGGAELRGDARDAMRCCLWLGTASHVLLRVVTFRCRALGELERKASETKWRDLLLPHVPITLKATSSKSRVYHTGAIRERVHNAIGAAFGRAPKLAKADEPDTAHVAVRFVDDVCTISIDATTTPLHRRGYRLDGRKAPLREDLAHALVLASEHAPDEALLDPFCGSGTIVIEAATRALGMPPGRLRPPPLTQTALFDADAWQALQAFTPRETIGELRASDRDAGAVQATKANAERAGVGHAITADACALAAQPWLQPGAAPPRGVLVSNPPYGLRVSAGGRLLPLYQTLGNRAAALGDGWRTTLLAHDVRLARRTGLPLRSAFTTRHGGLSVTAMRSAAGRSAEHTGQPD